MSSEPQTPRHADLDWLRVVAILLLLVFHVGMMFNPWPWHVKNAELLPALEGPWQLMSALRMPLLMVVAGAGAALALRRRSLAGFAGERARRLLIPLVFGIFVIVPPQIYIERIVQGICHPTYLETLHIPQFHGSYLDFYPMVLQFVPFPKGALSWHHLWFVAYLFAFCLLALPLFAWFAKPSGEAFLRRLEATLSRGAWIFLLFLPLALVRILLRRYPQTYTLIDDPKTVAYFGLLFLYGHLLVRCPALMDRIVALRRWSLGLAVALYIPLAPDGDFPFPFEHLAVYALVWCGILAALGFARAHIRVRKPWLAYAQELAYPFYILHQTVIVLLGYALLNVPLGPWTKMGLLLALSFLCTWLGCEAARRVRWLRPLLGMKPAPAPDNRAASVQTA